MGGKDEGSESLMWFEGEERLVWFEGEERLVWFEGEEWLVRENWRRRKALYLKKKERGKEKSGGMD